MADNAHPAPLGRTVVVVDDDDKLRTVLADALRAHGARVLEFADGRAAIDSLKRGASADLILFDLRMPAMDGWSFRVEQKRDPLLATIPVLAMSADASPQAQAIDADRFLAKPFLLDDLLGAIDAIFTKLARDRATATLLAEVGKLTTLAAGVAPDLSPPGGFALDAMGEARPAHYREGDIVASKYQLTSLLGEGGMGAVWLARNLALDLDVAVKLIRAERSGTDAAKRLLIEARAAARLTHPSIVRVFDYGETVHGDPFIVMELLRGQCFADVLADRRRLPALEAVQTLLPIANALCEAHVKGIMHRDLKPENIVLTAPEPGSVVPKLVDFGIAKYLGSDLAELTTSGSVLGSPTYMSPEQARGSPYIDERVDVWAMSVILYETVAGRRPFHAINAHALLTSIIEAEPVPLVDLAAGDEALWKIVQRGLAKLPEARWPSMREFGRALAEWADARGVETDIARASLRATWLTDAPPRPLSSAPPPRRSDADLDPAAVTNLERTSVSSRADGVSQRDGARRRTTAVLVACAAVAVLAFAGRAPLRGAVARAATAISVLPSPQTHDAVATSAPASSATTLAASVATPGSTSRERAETGAAALGTTTPDASPSQCALSFFPADAFEAGATPDLSFVCREGDPRKGAAAIKAELVRAATGKAVTEGMREWALLGWYEMPAYTVIRARCCPGSRVALDAAPTTCAPLDSALNEIAASGHDGIDRALQKYRTAVYCAAKTEGGASYPFDRSVPFHGGEDTVFRRLLARMPPLATPSAL